MKMSNIHCILFVLILYRWNYFENDCDLIITIQMVDVLVFRNMRRYMLTNVAVRLAKSLRAKKREKEFEHSKPHWHRNTHTYNIFDIFPLYACCPDSFSFPTHFRYEINFFLLFERMAGSVRACGCVQYLFVSCAVLRILLPKSLWPTVFAAAAAAAIAYLWT